VYPEDVRVVVRYAAFHGGSEEAIRLLEAARRQGKFEQTLSALFDRQEEWASHAAPNVEHIWKIAADVGVDVKRAQRDAQDAEVDAMLRQEAQDIYALKVDRTPTFYVNERPMMKFSPEHLQELVASEIERTRGPK
jgi:protein-disulfide isomerase